MYLLGNSDDSTLLEFVEEYLCREDPDNNEDDFSSGKVPLVCYGKLDSTPYVPTLMKQKASTWLLLVN